MLGLGMQGKNWIPQAKATESTGEGFSARTTEVNMTTYAAKPKSRNLEDELEQLKNEKYSMAGGLKQ